MYTLFSEPVYRMRLAAARQAMQSSAIDACVSIAPEHQFYFGGFDSWAAVNSPQAMVFTGAEDEPTLILRDVDLSLALESTWLSDIRTYHLHSESFPEQIKNILQQKGLDAGRVGIEMQSYALPHGLGRNLEDTLFPMELVDVTEVLGSIRLIKSPEEMEYIRRAGQIANLGLQALNENLRPGITEISLAAEIESALRIGGSDYWAIPVELTSGDRSAGCHGTPRHRVIETGDLVHAEFAGVCERYHATAIQTLCCGPADQRQQELYDLALQSLNAGIAAISPGVNVADVEQASLEPLAAHGLESAAMMRFGYGIGIAYPPIWLETLQISRDFDTRLEPGMAFVLHSCIELPNENLGVILGGTYELTDNGLNLLAGAGSTNLTIE